VAEIALPPGIDPPDVYVAAIGRSGSTMLCNWLCRPPQQLMFIEPFFLHPANPRLLRIQLADFQMAVSDEEWEQRDESGPERFRRIMGPRLAGRRWGFKEVLCEEHGPALQAFVPRRVIVTVRNLRDVALSFFEKHRLQGNTDRFDAAWVADYCRRESTGILDFLGRLRREAIPHLVVRYEDFTRSADVRGSIARFVGWEGGGRIDSHMERFDRQFEIERHGRQVSSRARMPGEREVEVADHDMAASLAAQATEYQKEFGYAQGS